MNPGIRVALADDHDLFREGVRALLAHDCELLVVGEASTGPEAVDVVSRLHPDVLLLDVEMPGGSARSMIGRVQRASPETRFIVLTMHRDAVLKRELLAAGATGYLTKSTPATDLIAAIRAVLFTRRKPQRPPEPGRAGRLRSGQLLSDRELEVLQLMAVARSNHAIAENLSITTGTVKRHASNIYRKLGASSRMDAVRRGERLGLLHS